MVQHRPEEVSSSTRWLANTALTQGIRPPAQLDKETRARRAIYSHPGAAAVVMLRSSSVREAG